MPDSITCNQCGKSYRLRDELRGRRVKCPNCKSPIPLHDQNNPTDEFSFDMNSLAGGEAVARPAVGPSSTPMLSSTPRSAAFRTPFKLIRPMAEWSPAEHLLFRTGLGCIAFGIVAIILPHFGFQLRKLARLGTDGSILAGWGLIGLGAFLAAYPPLLRGRVLKLGLLGIGGGVAWIAVLVTIGAMSSRSGFPTGPISPRPSSGGSPVYPAPPSGPSAMRGQPAPPTHAPPFGSKPPPKIDYDSLVREFGESSVVRVRFTNVYDRQITSGVQAAVARVKRPDGRSPTWHLSTSGDTAEMVIAPIADFDAFVRALESVGAATASDASRRYAEFRVEAERFPRITPPAARPVNDSP